MFLLLLPLQALNVTVRDVAAPGPVALPNYEGLIFIFVALGMGFIWLVSIGFLVCAQPLIWVSQRWQSMKNRVDSSAHFCSVELHTFSSRLRAQFGGFRTRETVSGPFSRRVSALRGFSEKV